MSEDTLDLHNNLVKGSRHDTQKFAECLRHFCGDRIQLEFHPVPVNFEDIKSLYHETRAAVMTLEAKLGGVGSVVIDITSGTKPCSAVGLTVALDRGRDMQYVSNQGIVSLWDVEPVENE